MDLRDHNAMPEPTTSAASVAASLVGRFLVAAPSMPDGRFQKSVVFMCKHDDDGALGIIVNNKVDDLPLGQVYKQLASRSPRRRRNSRSCSADRSSRSADWCCIRPTTSARKTL